MDALMMERTLEDIYCKETCELMDMYISRLKYPHDRQTYRRIFEDYFDTTGFDPLYASGRTMMEYVDNLKERVERKELKYTTALKYRKVIAGFTSFCSKNSRMVPGLIPDGYEDLMPEVRMDSLPDTFDAAAIPELGKLDDLVGYLKENDRLCLVAVLLSLRCFLKTGDLTGLTTEHIFSDSSGRCFVQCPSRNLIVPLPEDVKRIVEDYYMTLSEGDYLFSSPRSRKFTPCALENRLKKACEQLRQKNGREYRFTFNTLRSMAAVMAATGGVSAENLSDAMGYRSRAHIKKLSSLTLPASPGAEYVNIYLRQ